MNWLTNFLSVKKWTAKPQLYFSFLALLFAIAALSLFVFYDKGSVGAAQSPNFTTFLPLFPSVVILLVALWTSVFSAQSLSYSIEAADKNRETAQLQESMRLIKELELDSQLVSAKKVWAYYRGLENKDQVFRLMVAVFYAGDPNIFKVKLPETLSDDRDEPNSQVQGAAYRKAESLKNDLHAIAAYLNSFELAALAIEKEILHGEFYFEWSSGLFVNSWNNATVLVSALRCAQGNPNLFENWERVARDWAQRRKRPFTEAPEFSYVNLSISVRDLEYLQTIDIYDPQKNNTPSIV